MQESNQSQTLIDLLRSTGLAPGPAARRALREKNRRPRTRKLAMKAAAAPDTARVAADWLDFVGRCHAVYGSNPKDNKKGQQRKQPGPTPAQLLQFFNSLTPEARNSIIKDFETHQELHPDTLFALYHLHTVGSNLSKESTFMQVALHQIALQSENVVIYSIRFGDEFLDSVATRKHETITQSINKKIRVCLEQTFQEECANLIPIPPYFHVIDYTDEDPLARGPGGFHVHGMTVADNGLLPVIHRAFKKAADGYVPRYTNLAVHFGEPSLDYSNRGGKRTNCLSEYPKAIRIKAKDYTFNAASYASWKKPRAEAAGEALGVDVGNCWGRSKALRQEAEACLRLFKELLDNIGAGVRK